jgi:hypothetical protein
MKITAAEMKIIKGGPGICWACKGCDPTKIGCQPMPNGNTVVSQGGK